MKLFKGYKHKGSRSGIIIYFMGFTGIIFNTRYKRLDNSTYSDSTFTRWYYAEEITYDPST